MVSAYRDPASVTVAPVAVTAPMKPLLRNAESAPSTSVASSETSIALAGPSKPAISETVFACATVNAEPPVATTLTASNRVTRSASPLSSAANSAAPVSDMVNSAPPDCGGV